MKTWLILPDMQVPYHDQKTIDLIVSFAKDYGVTDIAHVGDEIDAPSPSRWVRGRSGEFAASLQKDIDATRRVLSGIVDVLQPDSFHLMRSNHGDRVRKYIDEKAPALAPLRALDWATLMDFEYLGITYHDKPFEFEKGFVLAHGDEGTMSKNPGYTALGLAKKWGVSVFCGHTHRLGMAHENRSLNGKVKQHIFGIEVGHAMRMDKASYLSALSANWQQGFALLEGSTPLLIPVIDHKVTFDGLVWNG